MREDDESHKAHRSGWHNMYEVDRLRQPVTHFVPQPPQRTSQPPPPPPQAKAQPPPPPPKPALLPKSPVQEFMEVTGVSDPDLAAQHVAAAAALGKSVRDAIHHYFDYGGTPMQAPTTLHVNAGAYAGMVGQLVEMGFDRQLAQRAASEHATLDEATEWCLQQQRAKEQPQQLPRATAPPPYTSAASLSYASPAPRPYTAAAPASLPPYTAAAPASLPPYTAAASASPPPYTAASRDSQLYQLSAPVQPPPQYSKPFAATPPYNPPRSAPPPHYSQGHTPYTPATTVPRPHNSAPLLRPPPPPYASQQGRDSHWNNEAAAKPVPPKPTLAFDDASMALFVDTKPKSTPSVQAPRTTMPAEVMGGQLPTPVVTATNPYGNAPVLMMSMPPMGVLDGAVEAQAARREAAKVSVSGKLHKLSGVASGRSRLGSRWQARHFVLGDSRLAYGDVAFDGSLKPHRDDEGPVSTDKFSGTKKSFTLWGSYVLPEPPERASGREFAFAVYRSDADAFAAASRHSMQTIGSQEEREQLLLLAADDAATRSRWICNLLAAAGRPGVLLRVGEDAAAIRLRCCYGSGPLELEAGAVGRNVLVRKVAKASGAGAVGVKVGDELVSVNGAPVPLLVASAVRRMLDAVPRPLELEFRRPRDATTARELAAQAVLSLGTDPDDEAAQKQRMAESLQVGEALRADRTAREQERAKRAAAAEAEAAAVGDAVAKSHAEARQRELVEAAIDAVRRAIAASTNGDNQFRDAHYDAAAASYRSAIDALMSVKDALSDPDGAARRAVNTAFPDLSLAQLFDHINTSGQAAVDNANSTQQDDTLASAASEHLSIQPQQQPQTEPPKPVAVALFDFASQADWQLSMRAGDHLMLLNEHDDGWSDVCFADSPQTCGLVPSSYIQIDGQTDCV